MDLDILGMKDFTINLKFKKATVAACRNAKVEFMVLEKKWRLKKSKKRKRSKLREQLACCMEM